MNSDEIRTAFLKFFEEKGHKVIPGSSLVPKGDPTLLLTTAGMVQIKPYFLGEAKPPSRRLASCQKCFRTTDIESVGDATHLTFFEMLGNFSVGDYFKKEAIAWAWEFFLDRMRLAPEKLWITIYLDDDESFQYWRDIGIPAEKILRFGEEDNFWGPAGNSGPCGPCSEIHYDFGEDRGCGKPDCKPNCECGRFAEIWNLVFTQYNQDESGQRTPLPRPNIDTGMGLERLTAVMAGKASVYETDLFQPLLDVVAKLTGRQYGSDADDDNAMRVVVEHGRGLAFLIADGVIPGNEGRGYVLRRLLRRAALFGRRLGLDKPFLSELGETAVRQMGHVYPELGQRRDFIKKVIELEETRFEETLNEGLQILENEIIPIKQNHQKLINKLNKDLIFDFSGFDKAPQALINNILFRINDVENKSYKDISNISHANFIMFNTVKPWEKSLESLNNKIMNLNEDDYINRDKLQKYVKGRIKRIFNDQKKISGIEAFGLNDTYGFPVELTKEIVGKSGFTVDMAGFEREMEKQRERARAAHKFDFVVSGPDGIKFIEVKKTEFVGY
ncbi:MAG: alanine--tRNA ligase, partial [Chloroflexota bacterium]